MIEEQSEVVALRARVAELETELQAQSRRTALVIAEAQEKLYWLERWQIDLDKVMSKPGAIPLLDALKAVRGLLRRLKFLKRRLT